jgi:hypothetical protein
VKFDESCFVNLTKVEVPREVSFLLSFGPKFSLPLQKETIPVLDLLTEIEGSIKFHFDIESQPLARANLVESINTLLERDIKFTKNDKIILKAAKKTELFIQEHENLFIINADKSNKTILVEQSFYDKKVQELLADTNTYTCLNTDPTKRLIKKSEKLIDDLINTKRIEKSAKKQLWNENAYPPRIYILLKLHKEGTPGRPVISSINSIGQPIAKFLAKILENIRDKNKYNFNNSHEFKTYIDTIQSPEHDHELVSFDVVSLFTNVPLDLVFEILENRWDDIDEYTGLTKTQFFDLLRFCLYDCNYFLYNAKIYKQKEGLAMGSSLSTVLSDFIMEKLLDTQIPKFPFKPIFFKKYIDDNITILPKQHINETLDILNNFHPKITFTKENQLNSRIPFLDMTLIKENGKIITNFYRKPTSSGRILNFHSAHPFHMKRNTAINFIKRIKRLSDRRFDEENKKIIVDTLTKNGYPNKFIKKMIKKFKYFEPKPYLPKETQNDASKNVNLKYAAMPFIPNFSHTLSKKLKNINNNIQFAYRPCNKLSQRVFTNTKTPIDSLNKAGVVYKIECMGNSTEECEGVYIGETSKKLNVRLEQHKRDIKSNSTKIKTSNCTALIKHINEKRHKFNPDKAKILSSNQNNTYKRRFMETAQIQVNKPAPINYKVDTQNLSATYCNIINKFKVIRNRKKRKK